MAGTITHIISSPLNPSDLVFEVGIADKVTITSHIGETQLEWVLDKSALNSIQSFTYIAIKCVTADR